MRILTPAECKCAFKSPTCSAPCSSSTALALVRSNTEKKYSKIRTNIAWQVQGMNTSGIVLNRRVHAHSRRREHGYVHRVLHRVDKSHVESAVTSATQENFSCTQRLTHLDTQSHQSRAHSTSQCTALNKNINTGIYSPLLGQLRRQTCPRARPMEPEQRTSNA